MKESDKRTKTLRLEELASSILSVISALSYLLMFFLMCFGLFTMTVGVMPLFVSRFRGIVEAFRGVGPIGQHSPSAEGMALGAALDGLEFIFLSPLALLLVKGIWDFIDRVRPISSQQTDPASPSFLVRIKVLIIGLMVAVVATELLKRSIAENGLSYEPAIAGSLFIAVLTIYSFLIERNLSHDRDKRDTQ